jgi:hypothetical protein
VVGKRPKQDGDGEKEGKKRGYQPRLGHLTLSKSREGSNRPSSIFKPRRGNDIFVSQFMQDWAP